MEKYNKEIKEQLVQQLADKGLSNAKAAPLIGVSPAALSQYLNGTYRSNPANLEGKIAEFLRAQDAREEMQEKAATYQATDNYVPTSISEDVYKTIQYCQLEKGMVIIHGDARHRQRILERIRLPLTSGNANHYVMWAREVAGVGYARCIPCWAGAGTVKVVIISDTGGTPAQQVLDAARAHVEGNAGTRRACHRLPVHGYRALCTVYVWCPGALV